MNPSDENSSVGTIVVILAVLILAGVMLASVVGGAWFVLQARMNEQQARVRAELAMVESRVAQMRVEEALALAEVEAGSQVGNETTLKLVLDAEGKVSWQGNELVLESLNERLEDLTAEAEGPLTAEVLADRDCPFEHVARVLEMVRGLGIEQIEIQQATPDEAPATED